MPSTSTPPRLRHCRRPCFLLLELFTVAAVLLLPVTQAATLRVVQGSSDTATYPTIGAAVDAAASSGDIIEVEPGTYNEIGIDITKALTLKCTSPSDNRDCIFEGTDGASDSILTIDADVDVTIEGFTFQNNKYIGGFGGAILHQAGTLNVIRCTFTSNTASRDCPFTSSSPNDGGAIYTQGKKLKVEDCTFSNNEAATGGAIYADAIKELEISGSTFSNNAVSSIGGAITTVGLDSFKIETSTFNGNSAVIGAGAIVCFSKTTDVSRCTFHSNKGSKDLYIIGGTSASFNFCTMIAHQDNQNMFLISNDSTASFSNSILAKATDTATTTLCKKEMTDGGHNLFHDDSCSTDTANTASIIQTTDLFLGELSDNGGSTFTIPLLAGSPARDMGPATGCLTSDQRGEGYPRPQGCRCDIGAFEVLIVDPPPMLVVPSDIPVNLKAGQFDSIPVSFQASATDADPAEPTTVTCTPASGSQFEIGSTTVACVATDATCNESSDTFNVTVVAYNDEVKPTLSAMPDVQATQLVATQFTAKIDYTLPTAEDDHDATNPIVTCEPKSGTVFQIGPWTVTCTATDAAGNIATDIFTVNVLAYVDNVKPMLTLPSIITEKVNANQGLDKKIVNFMDDVKVTDNHDPNPTVICDPVSGTEFSLGETKVTCTGNDLNSANTVMASFLVNVVEAEYFCPEKHYVSYADLSVGVALACKVADNDDVTEEVAEQQCSYVAPPSASSSGRSRDRDLTEDGNPNQHRELNDPVQAVQCAAGLIYNWTTRGCRDEDECIAAVSPCPTDEGSYCVDHDPGIRFECGCRRNFNATGYPVATTAVWYQGEYVDAVVEEAVNEQGDVSFYEVPVKFRPLGCESTLVGESPSPVPVDTMVPSESSIAAIDDPCADFGRPCLDNSEYCGQYDVAEDGSALFACLCKKGWEKIWALTDLRGCRPIDKCNDPAWNKCHAQARCLDDSPGGPLDVRCECVSGFYGTGVNCTRMTASPVSPAPMAPTVPEPIVTAAPTPAPSTRPRPVVCRNDCGFGVAVLADKCRCACEDGAELVNEAICLIPRLGSTFVAGSSGSPSLCNFKKCPGLETFIRTGGTAGKNDCATITLESCNLECAKTTCESIDGAIFTAAEDGTSWADPHLCSF